MESYPLSGAGFMHMHPNAQVIPLKREEIVEAVTQLVKGDYGHAFEVDLTRGIRVNLDGYNTLKDYYDRKDADLGDLIPDGDYASPMRYAMRNDGRWFLDGLREKTDEQMAEFGPWRRMVYADEV